MLVIFMNLMEDTDTFTDLYKDLNATILVNPSKKQALDAIKAENDTIVLFGHGSPDGLFSRKVTEYIVNAKVVPYLQNKKIIGIWCYAKEFAIANKLSGWFTNMWISNEIEAYYTIHLKCNNEFVFQENKLFANRINQLLRNNTPLHEWNSILATQYTKNQLNDFNYSNAEYLYFKE